MAVIGSFTDGEGVTRQVNLVTWCKATGGKIVYSLEVVGTGIEFQVECEQTDTMAQKIQKAKAAYSATKQAEAHDRWVPVYVPERYAEQAQALINERFGV